MKANRAVAKNFPRPFRFQRRADMITSHQMELEVDEFKYNIKNISESGVLFSGDRPLEVGETYSFALSLNGGRSFHEGRGVVVRGLSEDQEHTYALAFSDGFLGKNALDALDQFEHLKSKINENFQSHQQIPEAFQVLTLSIKTFLAQTKEHLDELDAQVEIMGEPTRASYNQALELTFEPYFVDALKSYARELDTQLNEVQDKRLRQSMVEMFRNEVGHFYNQSGFIGRALHKPRGYAGDYEMMNQIYRNHRQGRTYFEQLMHRYGINEASSLSVRYRKDYLIDKIAKVSEGKDHVVIGSLACGPAREIVEFISKLEPSDSHRYSFVLMDQDIEALQDAKRNIAEQAIKSQVMVDVAFAPLSVKHVLEQSPESSILKDLQFDFLYTAGLYDYLTQPVAQALTLQLLEGLKDDGLLIIGNFHPDNPTKTISELVADWTLIHRTEDQMHDLVAGASVKSKELHADDQKIDLFLEVIK